MFQRIRRYVSGAGKTCPSAHTIITRNIVGAGNGCPPAHSHVITRHAVVRADSPLLKPSSVVKEEAEAYSLCAYAIREVERLKSALDEAVNHHMKEWLRSLPTLGGNFGIWTDDKGHKRPVYIMEAAKGRNSWGVFMVCIYEALIDHATGKVVPKLSDQAQKPIACMAVHEAAKCLRPAANRT